MGLTILHRFKGAKMGSKHARIIIRQSFEPPSSIYAVPPPPELSRSNSHPEMNSYPVPLQMHGEDRVMDEADNESDLSEGGDLRDDMALALSGLDFDGDYALARLFPSAPNPWLTIKGLGTIGLHLTNADAGRIIFTSRQASHGYGNATLVDIYRRNTYEITSQLVSFENPEWQTFFKKTVLGAVRDGLRLGADFRSLRCEFHKLLLYETGSNFLPRQATPIEEDLFATVTILLPSPHCKGGEVHVSHSADAKVLDLPPNSFFQTNVLAWHTSATHSMQPIQSGYRLALHYNLIHTVPNESPSNLPVTGMTMAFLRRTLGK
ncbi:hypothetical protein BDN72DRAFT_210567 [Pluteus cervinus]|uniref:Uncharacterized protein n=1 Tax=Pluteus cervinus TaxID=181527 RepID=A0ACD3AHX4_9AGAR|nr:hypothetical protein BDN72DRAFT_210567 [Pluteus cervinus]